MDDCRLSNRPSDAYWIEGRDFDWKKCECGQIFRLKDNEVFPPHKPKPLRRTPLKKRPRVARSGKSGR